MFRHNKHTKRIRINLGPLPRDERVEFVNRVCYLMSEGRKSPERMTRLVVVMSDEPENEQALYYDATANGLEPSYPLGEMVDHRCSPIALSLGVCLATRIAFRDAYLNSLGIAAGPSP